MTMVMATTRLELEAEDRAVARAPQGEAALAEPRVRRDAAAPEVAEPAAPRVGVEVPVVAAAAARQAPRVRQARQARQAISPTLVRTQTSSRTPAETAG